MPEDYPYQHSRSPELNDRICIRNAPMLSEGHTTLNCIGPIVINLVQNKGWDFVDAIVIAASSCERCLNILLEETTGEPYDGRETSNTWCECCEMIDPEYDNHYKTVIQPEIDKRIEEDHLSCVGFKDLVAATPKEYGKVWISPNDEVMDLPPDMIHIEYFQNEDKYDELNTQRELQGEGLINFVVKKGWVRKGETKRELYFSVYDFDDKTISRLQKYIDSNPQSLIGKEDVRISFGENFRGHKSIPAEYVEKYGLKYAIQRSKEKLVNAFTLADLIKHADGGGSESLMLTPRNTDLAPQVDWRYPIRQEPNPTGFRPFMTDSPPGPKLKETIEDSHIFFFGPSFKQNLTNVKKD
jgi:hypothetical protein